MFFFALGSVNKLFVAGDEHLERPADRWLQGFIDTPVDLRVSVPCQWLPHPIKSLTSPFLSQHARGQPGEQFVS